VARTRRLHGCTGPCSGFRTDVDVVNTWMSRRQGLSNYWICHVSIALTLISTSLWMFNIANSANMQEFLLIFYFLESFWGGPVPLDPP
jgi:hypothetical protein